MVGVGGGYYYIRKRDKTNSHHEEEEEEEKKRSFSFLSFFLCLPTRVKSIPPIISRSNKRWKLSCVYIIYKLYPTACMTVISVHNSGPIYNTR